MINIDSTGTIFQLAENHIYMVQFQIVLSCESGDTISAYLQYSTDQQNWNDYGPGYTLDDWNNNTINFATLSSSALITGGQYIRLYVDITVPVTLYYNSGPSATISIMALT
ncbi:hypothetical protein J40TS1_29320 [Paenibacillus montaniterrae]|uniref:Uncharacterized protein n=1 Tax=Paenibacillus montaniterrae TaxID=429341 RepID=A0A919YQ02_9BACL|nr:hypothetical protein J40TS1_29320 [Paenibacillus montaniterrae]